MDLVTVTLTAISLFSGLFAVWFSICNLRVYKQRGALINWIFHTCPDEKYEAAKKAYESVDYDRHLWRLLTFRKPGFPKDLG